MYINKIKKNWYEIHALTKNTKVVIVSLNSVDTDNA